VPKEPHLSVVGTGVATGTPDQCQLQLALNCMADDTAGALSGCAELASKAIVAIADVDGTQCDVQTVGISVLDFFDKSHQRVIAKVATYELRVTVWPIDGVGPMLTALGAVAGDALAVRGFQLGIRDPEPLRSEARRLAVEDAQKRAAELSAAAGIRVGSLLSLRDGAAPQSPFPWRATSTAFSAASDVPVQAGEIAASSSVTMTYAIATEAAPA